MCTFRIPDFGAYTIDILLMCTFRQLSAVYNAQISGYHFDRGEAIRPPAHRRDVQMGRADGCVQSRVGGILLRVGRDSPPGGNRWN